MRKVRYTLCRARGQVRVCQHGSVIQERPVRFVGGGTVPARRLNTVTGTWPMAVLEIGPAGLSLRLRRTARAFGPERLEATPTTLRSVVPARGLAAPGVGFTDVDGREFYFWTYRRGPVLDLLTRLGYPVVARD